ncbi:hypothetical protein CDV31_014396 [Fusarium ambrosium]|uniref:Nephrocystin 3-like N-terminal domain-containing protein n=1 Tax=Fusarium ambrosium TaxID=131363 RepID=A0A428SX32_9HYPO|nr:hypothetical protein CDV31_014396 [Fusarium ambrosium]
MAQDRRQSERMLQDARLQVKEALAKHEKSFILEGHGRGHAVHNFTAKDDAKVEVGDHVHYTINNYADEQSKKVSKEEIMKWMKCTDFTTLYKERHLPNLFPNVGEGPLKSDEFKQWHDGTTKWLWCHGMPGVGKSALTTIIIRHILKIRKEMAPERNIGLAYVYCDYANKEQSALDYVGALLCQLISLSDEVSPEVTALYNDHKPGSSPLRPLLEGYELVLGAEVSRFDSVYIIVDALDECRDDDEGEFQSSTKVRVSETFGKLGETVHLLFTSREEHPPTSLTDRRVPIATMKVTATDEDIRTYVRAQIKRRESLKCYTDTELGEMIEIVITRKAAGMFLPAKLYMETLASKAGLRRGKKTIADALKNLPQFNHAQILESYQKAYQEILKNIWNQSPPRVERARQVLSWVIFTREPTNLTLPVLQRALSLQDADDTVDQGLEPTDAWEHTPDSGSEDDFEAYLLSDFDDGSSGSSTSTRGDVVPKETLLSVCRGLITMDKDTKLIRLVHYTARDYFSNENVRADLFPHAQNQLTRSCMTSLMSAGADHPFDQYSHRQWGHHAQPVEREFQTEILDLVWDQKRIMSSFQFVVDSLSPAWAESRKPAMPCLPPLHVAAYFGLELTATHLMDLLGSEEIKAEDSGGWTVMNWAVVGGSKTLVQLLFQREKDLLSNEIAFLAVGSRNHMVKTDTIDARDGEISLGASLTLKAGLSFTKALPRAVRPNASDDVVRFLMENIPTESIDVKRPGDERTLLSVVAENWQWGYVGILLERGASIDLKDHQGNTPLLWALNCPRRKIQVQLILVSGVCRLSIGEILSLHSSARVRISDHGISETALEPFICKLIGGDLEATNEDGRTALSLALPPSKHSSTVRPIGRSVALLLRSGADPDAQNCLGETPFSLAKADGLESFMRLLKTLGPRSREQAEATLAQEEQGDYAKLLLAMLDRRSRFHVNSSTIVGGATLSIQSSSAIETLMIVEEASVVLSGKPSIQSLVTADKSRIEIREASVIERLDTHGESRAVIHGSSRIQRMVGLGMSTLTIDAQAKIENLTTLNHCVVQVGGDSQVKEITGLDETTLIITAKARVEQMHITDGCTAFSNGNSSVSAAMGTGTSVLTLMGQSFIERFLGFHTCAVISEGEAKVYFINCTGHSFVLMKGRAEIRQISTQDEAIVLAEGEANLTTALGMGNSRLALDGDTKIETIFASGGCMVTLRGRSKLTTMSSQDHSVFTFDGDVTIANVMSFDRDEAHPDGSASGLTTSDDPLAVDERDWRRINEQGDRVVERGRAAWISAQEKMTEGEERRKKADEIQRRDEEWSWEPTGEEPDVFYWKWPLGSS